MTRRLPVMVLCAVAILCWSPKDSRADPMASWSAFKDGWFTGVTVTPLFTTGVLQYTVALSAAPTVTIGGTTYDVTWMQAVAVVSASQNEGFTATGSDFGVWKWDSKSAPGTGLNVAGWETTGANRLLPGQSQVFTFTTFDLGSTAVFPGYHVGYSYWIGETRIDDSEWVKDIPEVPAPLLAALGAPLAAFGHAARSRFRRR
jgi:hypothetical protein